VEFFDFVNHLIVDTKGTAEGLLTWTPDSSLRAFAPELTICATIVILLAVRLFNWGDALDRILGRSVGVGLSFIIALVGTLVALVLSAPLQHLTLAGAGPEWAAAPDAAVRMEIFTGMLVYDPFTIFIRSLLLVFVVLFLCLSRLTQIPDREDAADIYTLVLGSVLGMCLMASANHLLMIFLAVEMASVPSYALTGMLKGKRISSEAALKYAVYGAGAAGVMLYGISLIAGIVNTAHLPSLAMRLAELNLPEIIATGQGTETLMVLAMGGLMLAVGVAFKLSAVPFHFWAPDVFEGATAEVGAFLSVASKAAALALLVRVVIGFGTLPMGTVPGEEAIRPGDRTAQLRARESEDSLADSSMTYSNMALSGMFAVADDLSGDDLSGQEETAGPGGNSEDGVSDNASSDNASSDNASSEELASQPAAEVDSDEVAESTAEEESDLAAGVGTSLGRDEALRRLQPVRDFMARLIALLAVVTCTFGNLAAYGQTNIKRLLAYSTIAHAGYMMMAVPAFLALSSVTPAGAERAVAGLGLYMMIYLIMNLGAFAVVAFLRNEMRSEEIADYSGLIRRCPFVVIWFSLMLFSLVGLPPLAGFIGKFAVFAALADGFRLTQENYLIVLLVVGGLNTALSLFYYLRVVKLMTMGQEPDHRPPLEIPFFSLRNAYLLVLTVPVVGLIVYWEGISSMAIAAARFLLT
jgi:NADH-quinone oxidoreductase subunit N